MTTPQEANPSAPSVTVGCSSLPPGLRRDRYFERLAYLESDVLVHNRAKPSALKRWREGHSGAFGLVLSPAFAAAGFRLGPTTRDAEIDLERTVEALAPEVLILRTKTEFSPSQSNRDALGAWLDDAAANRRFGDATLVWEPEGLWEPRTAAALAAEHGAVFGCDPLATDPLGEGPEFFASLPGERAYFRLTGLGRGQRRFREDDFDTLEMVIADYAATWIVFGNTDRYPDAIRLRRRFDAVSPIVDSDDDDDEIPDLDG